MKRWLWFALAAAAVLPAGFLFGHWDPGTDAKWIQYPDLTPMGMDINAGPFDIDGNPADYVLADDWRCTAPEKIVGIHIWGSWLNDYVPMDDPANVVFTLSIHADIPADQNPDGDYSTPGEPLWVQMFQPGAFTARAWEEGIMEGWMDPPELYLPPPADTVCWQYNFDIPADAVFEQQGSEENPVIYWLDVKAEPMDPEARFGWKTSIDHWNDAAVFGRGLEPYPGPWRPLVYPPGHEYYEEPIDLAFVIVGEPLQPPELDYGDAPDVNYHTLAASNGARHVITPNFYLGTAVDPELNGLPDVLALRDDLDAAVDDEDGVDFLDPFYPGANVQIEVEVFGGGILNAWFDYDASGDWDAAEQVFGNLALTAGTHPLTLTVPGSAAVGFTYARFRLSGAAGLDSHGPYPDGTVPLGEVEDYRIIIVESPEPEFDFGDAPDSNYHTLLASDGARHRITDLFLGDFIDPEPDGQPGFGAVRDDLDATDDDEDGVTFSPATPIRPGAVVNVDIQASADGFLDAWIDFNQSGHWTAPDRIFTAEPILAGTHTYTFTVPGWAKPDTTYARFRFSATGGLRPDGIRPTGIVPVGEVEDYAVIIGDRFYPKWIQPPDLTPLGIDVNACTYPDPPGYILADDFLCRRAGPLTNFHIWGSWLDDYIPFQEDPRAVDFTLSIHADIPADQSPTGYSMPGPLLWVHEFPSGTFGAERFAAPIEEGWMDPPESYVFPADWTCWLYKFHVPFTLAFHQEGTAQEPIVYWLDLKAVPHDQQARFGWKTSIEHWNDDAVWGFGEEPYAGPWRELIYPPGHELQGQSIDLAFALYEEWWSPVDDEDVPRRTGLKSNAPNPFNPATVIHFVMPAGGAHARIEVFDTRGRLVNVVLDEFRDGGEQTVVWDGRSSDGRNMPSGVYFYRLKGATGDETMKMLLLR